MLGLPIEWAGRNYSSRYTWSKNCLNGIGNNGIYSCFRKGTLIFGNVLNLASGLMFFAAKYVHSVEVFFVGRIVVGFIAGKFKILRTGTPIKLFNCSVQSMTFEDIFICRKSAQS